MASASLGYFSALTFVVRMLHLILYRSLFAMRNMLGAMRFWYGDARNHAPEAVALRRMIAVEV
jgi:hypothetical protein